MVINIIVVVLKCKYVYIDFSLNGDKYCFIMDFCCLIVIEFYLYIVCLVGY